jgi:hypothetical protein
VEEEECMKFLSMTTVKDTFSMLPAAAQRQLLEATVAWVGALKKSGEILETPEGSVVICEDASVEQFMKTQASIPMGGFMNFKVYPLADFDASMKAYIEACKRAEQMSSQTAK